MIMIPKNSLTPIQKQKYKHMPYRIYLHGFERGALTYIVRNSDEGRTASAFGQNVSAFGQNVNAFVQNDSAIMQNATSSEFETKTSPAVFTESYHRRISCEKSFLKNSNINPKPYILQYIIHIFLVSTLGKRGCIFTDNIEYANVLVESVCSHYSLRKHKKWRLSFFVSDKPILETPNEMSDQFSEYSAIITPFGWGHPACIDFLPFIPYMTFPENSWNRLLERPIRRAIPSKFCCCIAPESAVYYRTRMVQELSKYKPVDSFDTIQSQFVSYTQRESFTQVLSQYKFVLCFESAIEGIYMTEKIIQVFLAGVIPIYFGTSFHTTLFNRSAYVYLEKDATVEYTSLVRRIVYLDKHDSRYFEMANQPVFADLDIVDELQEQYGIDTIASRLNDRIATLEKATK